MSAPTLLGDVRGVQLYSDGKVVRTSKPMWPNLPADESFKDDVGSRDFVLNKQTGLWIRVYLPSSALNSDKKIPVMFYFHGGGFVAFNPNSSIFHNLCNNVSPKLGMLVLSVGYRLAPEHRLPAAFEDCLEVLKWMQQRALEEKFDDEPWLKHGDFSNSFLMGHSAGGTIVHQMAVEANKHDLSPLKIRGLIPVVPFFGGVARSKSEIRSLTEPDVLTLPDCDTFWLFSLPEGADRDHDYCRVPRAEEFEKLEFAPSLVVIGAKDVLHSRQVEYFEELKKAGKDAKLLEYRNRGHMLLFPEIEDDEHHSYNEMSLFIDKCMSSTA